MNTSCSSCFSDRGLGDDTGAKKKKKKQKKKKKSAATETTQDPLAKARITSFLKVKSFYLKEEIM